MYRVNGTRRSKSCPYFVSDEEAANLCKIIQEASESVQNNSTLGFNKEILNEVKEDILHFLYILCRKRKTKSNAEDHKFENNTFRMWKS